MRAKGGNTDNTVYVGNIPFNSTHSQMFSILSGAGPVKRFRLMTDKQTGQHRSFGFCEYHDTAAAQHAVSHLNRAEVNGRHLKVAARIDGDTPHNSQASTTQTLTSQVTTLCHIQAL